MAAPEKKEAPAAAAHAPKAEKAAKGGALPGGCQSWGCKTAPTRFNFCEEHFDHFKFGLIKKTGEPVSDYEKKYEHYRAYVAKRGGKHKVA